MPQQEYSANTPTIARAVAYHFGRTSSVAQIYADDKQNFHVANMCFKPQTNIFIFSLITWLLFIPFGFRRVYAQPEHAVDASRKEREREKRSTNMFIDAQHSTVPTEEAKQK